MFICSENFDNLVIKQWPQDEPEWFEGVVHNFPMKKFLLVFKHLENRCSRTNEAWKTEREARQTSEM
jgi:hypothetical protein